MKGALLIIPAFFFGSVFGQVHPENYTYSDDDTLFDTTSILKNEFSFHIIPIYQIFSGSSSNYNVLFQYKRQISFSNRAVTASLLFNESAGELKDSNKFIPMTDSAFYYHGMQQSSYIGGMLGYEWFTPISPNWKLFYGANVLFLYGRHRSEASKYQFVKDSLSSYYSYNSRYKSEDTLLYKARIFRPGLSVYGGVEYKFNRNFGLSVMAVNNIYFDIIEDQLPVAATRSEINFDLLRIFLMLKVYF